MSAVAGAGVAAVGALVLLGWTFGIEELKSVYGPITMKTNAAIGLLLAGTALWSHAGGRLILARAAAAACTAIGVLTLGEHVFSWNLGIDQLLFAEPVGAAATASPNRMGPNAATNLTLSGVAIVLLARGTPRAIVAAQRCAIAGLLLDTLALAGYIYGAAELYATARYTGIALHTAITLVVLNVGILAARVDAGPMAMLVSDGVAGTLLRRLLIPVILIPFVFGYIVLLGRQAELFDRGLSFALYAVVTVVVLGAAIWTTARTLAASEEQRRQAELERDRLLVRERRARDEAEQANRLKDQFLATLSHELRTPLNVMLGWTQILDRDQLPERRARAAAVVARNGRLLARLVGDLLDISRASAGQFEIARRPMAFNPAVQGTVDALGPVAAEKGVNLVAHLDQAVGEIDGDSERIQQIIWNLLSNGIKFTPPGGTIDVRTVRQDGMAVMTVSDTGIGFDESFAVQLFEPFRQADPSMRRAHGGLGLGLSIARHIAELHGGSVTGSSAGPGRGATFVLRLPAHSGC